MKQQLPLLAAACMTLATPLAFAQARMFEGFSLGVNAEAHRITLDSAAGSDSGNSTGLGLQAQYTFALNNQFVLGVGASYGTGNRAAAAASGPLSAEINVKDMSSFDFLPGYAISDSLLVYGKISALGATGQNNTLSKTYSLSGVGYGLGVRSMIDKNMFFQAGYDWNTYNDVTDTAVPITLTPKGYLFSLGVGYKF